MKKRILLTIIALAAVAFGVVGMSAFEAHVINVTAKIENATQVSTDVLNFGTVFPEESLNRTATLSMSTSFLAENGVNSINYFVRQKPKCWNNTPTAPQYGEVTEVNGQYQCVNQGYEIMPMLCPFLSKHPDVIGAGGNDGSLDAYHGPLTTWTLADTLKYQVNGQLAKSTDESDQWNIDLKVPCFQGKCAQDNVVPEAYQVDPNLESSLFGCALWFEVNGIVRTNDNPGPVLLSADITSDTIKIGDLNGANLHITGTQNFHTLDVANVSVNNPPLADGRYAFYLQANAAQQTALINYFTNTIGLTGIMLTQITSEINGASPFFYLKAAGGVYSLVDGFQYALTSTDQPLVINDNYPLGSYTYSGMVNAQAIVVTLNVVNP